MRSCYHLQVCNLPGIQAWISSFHSDSEKGRILGQPGSPPRGLQWWDLTLIKNLCWLVPESSFAIHFSLPSNTSYCNGSFSVLGIETQYPKHGICGVSSLICSNTSSSVGSGLSGTAGQTTTVPNRWGGVERSNS